MSAVDLREALRRIVALTPVAANAADAHALHCAVKAIAETALAAAPVSAGDLDALVAREVGLFPAVISAHQISNRLAGERVDPHQGYVSKEDALTYAHRVGRAALRTQQAGQAEGEVKLLTQAALDVLAERQRQISAEGWTPAHDDQHDQGEMATAAATYAFNAFIGAGYRAFAADPLGFWPWDQEWFKPTHPYRDLEKAGALILAEMERLNRAALAAPMGGEGF